MRLPRITFVMLVSFSGLLVSACSTAEAPSNAQAQDTAVPATAVPADLLVDPTQTMQAGGPEGGEMATAEGLATAPAIEPIEVTYITPSQQEGPYYTVNKPEDRDNDLVDFAGATGLPAGQILVFSGKVYDFRGMPVEGAVVEIWQTDANGVYLHPNDPGASRRDPNFQSYGEAVTTVNGGYQFRTILPGLYEPRPRHIHVKVRLDGEELLTTQFYFAGEINLQGDQAAMLIDARPGQDTDGNPILIGERDIILNVDLSDR